MSEMDAIPPNRVRLIRMLGTTCFYNCGGCGQQVMLPVWAAPGGRMAECGCRWVAKSPFVLAYPQGTPEWSNLAPEFQGGTP